MIKNFLTFDIEEWFHANYEGIDPLSYCSDETNLEANVNRLIDICAEYNVHSTCFILGDVARQKPHIVREIFNAGHEIASHGCSHKLIYPMQPEAFRHDLRESADILAQITGEAVVGFRAPSWSIKRYNMPWFYQILEEEGFLYSSSVYPAKNTLFGIANFPQHPHYPTEASVLEIPQSVMNLFGNHIGYAGGGYLRFFPTWLIKQTIKKKNRAGESVFIYLHPREIDPYAPRLKLGRVDSYFHYQGVEGTEQKLHHLIREFAASFVRMDTYATQMNQKTILRP